MTLFYNGAKFGNRLISNTGGWFNMVLCSHKNTGDRAEKLTQPGECLAHKHDDDPSLDS